MATLVSLLAAAGIVTDLTTNRHFWSRYPLTPRVRLNTHDAAWERSAGAMPLQEAPAAVATGPRA
jgi:hypothetical protein